MTPEDRERLETLADANGMTAAKLVRTVMLDRQTELLAA
jgi:hypothetical protein